MQINSSYHIEEFIEKQETMEVPDAKLYFFRAGILKAITDAMAIIDLHCENIMPTQKGPIIIDAEIDFFHYNADSNLEEALSKDTNNDCQYSETTFIITYKVTDEITGKTTNFSERSGKAFSDNKFDLKSFFTKGYEFMKTQMQDKKEDFTKAFEDHLNNITNDDKIRLLPVRTQEFSDKLQSYITTDDHDEIINEIMKLIKEGLLFKNFLNKEVEIELFTDYLEDKIKEAFDLGTIPAMYADMNGNLFLNDTNVGQVLSKSNPEGGNDKVTLLKNKVKEEEIKEIMKKCFLAQIDLNGNSSTLLGDSYLSK